MRDRGQVDVLELSLQYELRPLLQPVVPPMILESIYALILQKRAVRLRYKAMLREERVARERVEEILREVRDVETALREILMQFGIDEMQSRARFLDRFEELAGYYQVLGWEFTHLCIYLGAPYLVPMGSTSQAPPLPPFDVMMTPH